MQSGNFVLFEEEKKKREERKLVRASISKFIEIFPFFFLEEYNERRVFDEK